MAIDVICLQHNQVEHTLRFLRSFRRYAPEDARLIFVDNGSNRDDYEKAVDYMWDLNHVVLELPSNEGFVGGVNAALKLVEADFVVLQNNDTEIYYKCYETLRSVLQENPKAGVVGAVSSPCGSWVSIKRVEVLYPAVAALRMGKHAAHEDRARVMREGLGSESTLVPSMVPFFCVMLPRQVIEQVGELSTDYGVGLGDDDDYCARIRKAGLEVRLSLGTYVFHNHRTTFKSLYSDEEIAAMQKQNVEIFLDKHRRGK